MALSNNDIIKKLRVALQLKDTDIIHILKLVEYDISKTELSAFFRSDDHPNFVKLKDQILRNFLNGLVIYKRGPMPKKGESPAAKPKAKEAFTPKKVFQKPQNKFIKPTKKS